MKQFLITAAGVFAGLMIFLIGVPFVLIVMAASAAGPAPVPARTVLELDLRDPLTDQSPQNPLAGSVCRRTAWSRAWPMSCAWPSATSAPRARR